MNLAAESCRNAGVRLIVLSACLLAVACGGKSGAGATSGSGAQPAVSGVGASASGTGGPKAGTGSSGKASTGPTSGSGTSTAGNTATAGAISTAGNTGASGNGSTAANSGASVLQYHKHANRDGLYVDAAFTRAAAAMLKKDSTFTAAIAGPTYAQPLYFEGGVGGKDLVITATEQNEVSAFNAADGSMVWKKTLGAPATSGLPCGNITNPLGVTGTPVIDAASKTLFVAAMLSGPKAAVFALSLDDGATRSGWPVDVGTVKAGSVAFNAPAQLQRGALVIVGNTVYIPYGGHFGDCSDYHGWVVGVPMDKPSAPIGFATKANGGGIWAPGGLSSDGTSVFAATGNTMSGPNGLFTAADSWGHGEAVLRLGQDLKNIEDGQTADFFAAQNWSALDTGDSDIGSSGSMLFDVPGATPSKLAIALGKSGGAYLIDRTKLGGMGGELQTISLASAGGFSGAFIQAPVAYTTPTGTFVVARASATIMGCGTGNGVLGAVKIAAASPPTMSVAWCAGSSGNTSPIVTSTDGTADSVVWYIAGGQLLGFNGETGAPVFNGVSVGSTSPFQTPIAAKGRIFVASDNALVAFTLK